MLNPPLADAVERIGTWLVDLYALDLPLSLGDFVMDPAAARAIAPSCEPRTGVLAVEEADTLNLGLYVDERDANDWGTLVEETSHLVCLAWHAARDLPVSQLLLELQSDVDRFVFRHFAGEASPVRDPFDSVLWSDALDAPTRERYRSANRRARRFCHGLRRRFPRRRDRPAMVRELRAFYRAAPHVRLGAHAR